MASSREWLRLDYQPLKLEQEVRRFWEERKIRQRLEEFRKRTNRGSLGFVEGPPTLNGVPHVGHARGRVIKDLRYRLKTMQGYYMTFWAGWDCQGLPVEVEVEKELGVRNKRELLERVGEERFVEECKKSLKKYHREWFEADRRLGIFINHEKAYWTHLDEYIEREWQYLKRAWEQGLLGEDYYVVAYCPHCQTSLSNAEVGLGYEEVEDPSLYFKVRVAGSENEYFVVWTTMPFTIVTDMMLAVHPEAEYAKVQVDGEVWILAESRVEPTMKELGVESYRVVEVVPGRSLEGIKYEYPFLDLVPRQRELDQNPLVHTVVCEEFVDITTATGVVHLSPGNGEDDFNAARRRGVPIYVPFDDECRFTEEAGSFAGLFARDADDRVVEELRRRGLLLSIKTIRHEYPTCWRCHHKLIWLARREYFLWTNRINDRVMEAAGKVEYFYEGPKNRFLSFLREGKPWCISRERVWGTPLPIWVCERCGHKVLVASRKELMERAIRLPDGRFELHKPWIDQVVLRCERCGGEMRREPFVLDCWHNSGASPYARFTDEEFRRYVPVDFLVEAVDQTRGWANSLLLEHVILTGRPEAPYKAFLFYGFVLDERGRKMSKSLGNVIVVNDLLRKQSADICRFYLLWKCSPVETMNFDVNEMNKRPYQVLSTLYHLHRFFMQNAEYDGFNPKVNTLEWAERVGSLKPVDRWLLSKLQQVIREVTERLERCEFHLALARLEDFVIETVSRQYVPAIRRELWTDDPQTLNRRLAIYATLWNTLKTLILLFNPITPHLSEAMYQKVYRQLDDTLPESVNFESWPEPNEALRNPRLEKAFDALLECISLAYSARQSARMKRRWPLRKAIVVAPAQVRDSLKGLEEVFLELANVKEVELLEEAPRLDPERWSRASEGAVEVYLDTYRDESLVGEGLMRDLARRIQALRKDLGFMPTDILRAVHIAGLDARSRRLLDPFLDRMRELVRAREVRVHERVVEVGADWHERRLDGKTIHIAILGP